MCRSKVNPSQSVVCDISIIISSYNASHNLNICLKQLLQQSIINRAEIIVIDSGSEQDESDICSQFACIFPALIYERTERESLYAAWNRGLSKARGLYFVNVNTDDALAPDALEGFVRALENDASAALAYADCVWSPVPNAQYPWPNSWKAVCYESYSALTTLFYCFTGCNQFWRTSSLRELGGFNPLLRAVGDYEILCRMATQRMKAIHIPRALSAFYQNPKGLSQISSAANEEFLTVRVNSDRKLIYQIFCYQRT